MRASSRKRRGFRFSGIMAGDALIILAFVAFAPLYRSSGDFHPQSQLLNGMHSLPYILLHLLAGFGAYFAARSVAVSRVSAWIAAASYMLSGCIAPKVAPFASSCALVLLPWTLGCVPHVLRSRRGWLFARVRMNRLPLGIAMGLWTGLIVWSLAGINPNPECASQPLAFFFPELPYIAAINAAYPGLLALCGLVLAITRFRIPRVIAALLSASAANLLLSFAAESFAPKLAARYGLSSVFLGAAMLAGILASAWGLDRLLTAIHSGRAQKFHLPGILARIAAVLAVMALAATVAASADDLAIHPYLAAAKAPARNLITLLAEISARQFFYVTVLALLLHGLAANRSRKAALALILFAALDMSSAVKRTWPLVARIADEVPAQVGKRP